jgi:hypothetical protein
MIQLFTALYKPISILLHGYTLTSPKPGSTNSSGPYEENAAKNSGNFGFVDGVK